MRKITLNEISGTANTGKANYILILNDRSGSMRRLHDKVTFETNNKIKEIVEQATKTNITTYLCVADFSIYRYWGEVAEAKDYCYKPKIESAGTNLYLALSEALAKLQQMSKGYSDEAFLLLAMTDGHNEPSTKGLKVSEDSLKQQISSLPENFTVTLMGPKELIDRLPRLGIPRDNALIWEGTETSYVSTMAAQSVGLGSYYASRSMGGTSTQSFYTVAPDKILDTELKALKELKPTEFSLITNFQAKIELAQFLFNKGFKFLRGANYYQLLKPEKIQENKDLLVYDPATNKLYGGGGNGALVRRFLGLPDTGTILVHPTKGKYQIYVQSNSNNRKLISWKDKTTGEQIGQGVIVLL